MTLHHLPTAENTRTTNDASNEESSECQMVLASFWDYLDGNCTRAVAERIEAHVSSCLPCLRYRRFQERFFASLAAVRERSGAPPQLVERVRDALAAERRQAPSSGIGVRGPLRE